MKYPTLNKCVEAAKDEIPIARLYIAALLLLKDYPPYNESWPEDLHAELVSSAMETNMTKKGYK